MASGHPDEVSSKSIKACAQETVSCGAKKERKNANKTGDSAEGCCLNPDQNGFLVKILAKIQFFLYFCTGNQIS